MYAVYNYAAGATAANVASDMIKLMTGETNKANLSADCVQANTSIVSTVAAGWTVHDAAAGTNTQVLKALCADGTTWKYYKFGVTSTTATVANHYESWNATTHAGTNACFLDSYGTGVWASTQGGYFYLYVTPRNIIFFSFASAAYQNLNGGIFVEYTRDGVLPGYPCTAQWGWAGNNSLVLSSGGNLFTPRSKIVNGAGDLTSGGFVGYPFVYLAQNCAAGSFVDNSGFYRDASEANLIPVYKLGAAYSNNNQTNVGRRYLGECYDILAISSAVGTARDEFTYGGKTYVLHGNPASGLYMGLPKE